MYGFMKTLSYILSLKSIDKEALTWYNRGVIRKEVLFMLGVALALFVIFLGVYVRGEKK